MLKYAKMAFVLDEKTMLEMNSLYGKFQEKFNTRISKSEFVRVLLKTGILCHGEEHERSVPRGGVAR